jgi:hypothetical protein
MAREMTDAIAVIRRFSAQELAVRRLHASDPDFRALCEDYATAICAFERWRDDEAKAEHYRQIIEELEDEIAEFLEAQQRIPHRPN